jgi:hypothetical protein
MRWAFQVKFCYTVSINFTMQYLEYLSQIFKMFKRLYDIIPTNAYSTII